MTTKYKNASKLAPCPTCCPAPGRACFRMDTKWVSSDDSAKAGYVPVWICENCRHELPRKVLERKTSTEATPSQQEALARWLKRNLMTHNPDSELHDIVQPGTEKTEFQGRNMLWSGTIGPKSRKGCLFLCDTMWLLKIGPNGGVEELYNSRKTK